MRLAARKRRRGLTQPKVAEANLVDRPQGRRDWRPVSKLLEGVGNAEAKYVGNGQAVDLGGERGVSKPGPVAGGALDADVGQVLDIQVNVTEPPAGRALALAGVEREVPGLPAPAPSVGGTGENPADLVERPGVSRRC